MITRRDLLKGSALAGLGILGAGMLDGLTFTLPASAQTGGFGALQPDPAGVLDLPVGFRYDVVSRAGQALRGQASGLVPGRPDGTAAFPGPSNGVWLVNNHEQGGTTTFPAVAAPELTYDPGATGGTTTLLVDKHNQLVSEYVSLAGTFNNCAGGATPWGTWLTCEETEQRAGSGGFTRDHGFVFEVSPDDPGANEAPTPLSALGRFAHEAVVVDPERGHLYLTEDASSPNGLLYRFTPATLPNALHTLRDGGVLEAFSSPGVPDLSVFDQLGTQLPVQWTPVPDPSGIPVSTRKQFGAEVTRSRKYEGLWWGNGRAYVVCSFARFSDGSAAEHDGQVWSYDPAAQSLTLEAYFPVNTDPSGSGADVPDGPDNITVNPWGGVLVAEDGIGTQHLVAVVEGQPFLLARNALSESEFTGVNFAPDRHTLFANIQDEGYVLAITGPFARLRRV
ncbi:MAG TPA: alkaline phosphatase PhoX [Acidimicrobiia bacterium]|nr:alkaline phosphatase PhoX [Acidimicrobiia bacterium]